MAKGKLYGNKGNFRTQKVLIAAKLGKSDIQLAGETAPTENFPLGVTPAFEGEGVLLFGAESIALHLSECDSKNFAEIVQWLQWAEGSLLPAVLGYVLPSVSAANLDSKVCISKWSIFSNYFLILFIEVKFNEFSAKLSKSVPKSGDKKKKESAKPKVVEENLDDEGAVPEKAKDPFADLPKGTFVYDAFKRVYSNEDTATKAIPYFWDNFDAEANSIWKCEYKYPKELTLAFMSCNLISGMYQRLEKLKKNAFASMILFGSDNDSTISGIWVWKGQDLAFLLSPDWQVDYESYTWTKLDPKDEKVKTMVNEYFMWEGQFDGKTFNQGKIFK
uniref:EF-1-gamma C-terminal domain-containing protein n=1 Tax=Heterorhabditis bacteriophora TaxID=37862 RepID=A0A1I7XL90_HETBA